jgi:uncharacterized membrane protein YdjX (TVP38/TMEM64 family)
MTQSLVPDTGAAPEAPASRGRGSLYRILGLAATVATLAGVAAVLPLHRLPELVDRLGVAGMLAAVPLGALLLSGLVPRSAISLACGALFGPLAGAACALGAALLAATGTFVVGRWLGREAVAGWSRRWNRLGRLDALTARRGLLAVIVVRLMPIAPFGVIGYAYGASSVRIRHYLLGTLLAGLPATFSYTALGAATTSTSRFHPVTLVPTISGFLVTAAVLIHFRRHRPTQPSA